MSMLVCKEYGIYTNSQDNRGFNRQSMKKLFITLFLPSIIWAFSWDYTHDFVLKKDEVATIEVLKREDSSKRILTLRWTLYQNKRLVTLISYDGFPTQHILQKEYKRNSIKIALRDDYYDVSKRCYLIVKFYDFDESNKTATMKVSIRDPKKRIEIKFSDLNTSKG